jgi:hypothetical protein
MSYQCKIDTYIVSNIKDKEKYNLYIFLKLSQHRIHHCTLIHNSSRTTEELMIDYHTQCRKLLRISMRYKERYMLHIFLLNFHSTLMGICLNKNLDRCIILLMCMKGINKEMNIADMEVDS